jgi:hypothetical protein
MDTTGEGLHAIYLGGGVTKSDVMQIGNSLLPSGLKVVRSFAGPLPESFWNVSNLIGTSASLHISDSLNVASGKPGFSNEWNNNTTGNGSDVNESTYVKFSPRNGSWWQVDLGDTYAIQQIELMGVDTTSLPFGSGLIIAVQGSTNSSFDSILDLGTWNAKKQGIVSDWWIGPEEMPPVRYIRLVNKSSDSLKFSEIRVRGHIQTLTGTMLGVRKPKASRPGLVFDPNLSWPVYWIEPFSQR